MTAADPVARARRLARALHAGHIGTWVWYMADGRVEWDTQLEALFGLEPGAFEGTFDGWVSRLHPDDRDRVLRVVSDAVERLEPFRFDHRCVWPDGATHWLEGVGEVLLEHGRAVGAVGMATSIDDRRHAEEERRRLLRVERAARERSEYLARVHQSLGRSLDLDAIVEVVTAAAVPYLADWCSVVLVADHPPSAPMVAIAHVDPDMVVWAKRLRDRYPYDPDDPMNVAAAVVRTGQTICFTGIEAGMIDARTADRELAEILKSLDLHSCIIVPIPSAAGPLGVLELVRTSSSPEYTEVDRDLAEDVADRIGAALHNAIMHRRQVSARNALATLQQVTGPLAEAVTTEDVAMLIADRGRAGLRADRGMVYLLHDDGQLRLVAEVGSDSTYAAEWSSLDLSAATPVTDAARTGRPVVLTDRDEIGAAYPTLHESLAANRAIVAWPLVARRKVIGAIAFTFSGPQRFADDERDLIDTLAGRCASAIERARLYEHQRAISVTLQRRLLPELPELPGWLDAAARYLPAAGGEVGGDWYQVIELGDGSVAAAVGDAVGRGIPAAAAMGQLRAAVATACWSDPRPHRVVAAVDAFAAAGSDTLGGSLAYVLIRPQATELTYSVAGHVPPMLRSATGHVEMLDAGRGLLLGLRRPRSRVAVAKLPLAPGDALVLCTDGLVERRKENIDVGLERLRNAVARTAGSSADEICDSLLADLLAGRDGEDDVAVLVLRRRPPAERTTPSPKG